jgi:hypothetical protein
MTLLGQSVCPHHLTVHLGWIVCGLSVSSVLEEDRRKEEKEERKKLNLTSFRPIDSKCYFATTWIFILCHTPS